MKQGSRLLQVTGILLILFAAFSLVADIIGFAGITALFGIAGSAGAGALVATVLLIGNVLSALISLIAGILGAKNWDNPYKAKGPVVMGIIILALNVLGSIGTLTGGGVKGSDYFGVVMGLLLPVLYTVGTFQLKNQKG